MKTKNRTTSFDLADVYDAHVTSVGHKGHNEIALWFGNYENSKKLVIRTPVGPATEFLVEQIRKVVAKQAEALASYATKP